MRSVWAPLGSISSHVRTSLQHHTNTHVCRKCWKATTVWLIFSPHSLRTIAKLMKWIDLFVWMCVCLFMLNITFIHWLYSFGCLTVEWEKLTSILFVLRTKWIPLLWWKTKKNHDVFLSVRKIRARVSASVCLYSRATMTSGKPNALAWKDECCSKCNSTST